MKARVVLAAVGVLVVVGLPLAGKWMRRHQPPECARDGLPIDALYRVRVDGGADESFEFCCIDCAALWLDQRAATGAAVYVTDEAGTGEVDARAAHFVRSSVVTNPVTGNRVHAFRDLSAAQEHARAFHGQVLHGAARPFGE